MAIILMISNDEEKIKNVESILTKNSHEFLYGYDETFILDSLKVEQPDIILFDSESKLLDLKAIHKKIHLLRESVISILLTDGQNIDNELLKSANAFLMLPLNEDVLIATINANLRNKKSLEMLSTSNQELAQSYYQLNVLYNISSQFASTLDKDKLMDIMLEGMDKALGFSLACSLTFRSEKSPVLIIHSVNNLSDRLLEALKLRAVLNYKSLFENKEIPFKLNIEDLQIEKHIKNQIEEYDFSILRYDNMFSQITLSENFFGFIEIYRQNEFKKEDIQCFHTIAQQVSLPLRNASLYQEIKEANVKLKKLEHLKSEFISIVSHELRTPLVSIKNSVDIVLSGRAGEMSPNTNKFMTIAKNNVNRLSGIINDLLDLSKIEAGKLDYKFTPSNIEPVIKYVTSILSSEAAKKNIELKVNLHDDFAYVFADTRRLEQVLNNLIANAIKFTPEGKKIEISTSIVDANDLVYDESFKQELSHLSGKYLQVCVADEGIGIDKSNLPHVFDKFEQIENSLSREVGGTGLGLPITRQLLDAHNGAIWVDSELDRGSKFYFVLPISSDKTNFWITHKQLIQQAKVNKSTIATFSVTAEDELINAILNTENLINPKYLKNSLKESIDGKTKLTIVIPDGDSNVTQMLKSKINATMLNETNKYQNHDIIYSYTIYPEEHN